MKQAIRTSERSWLRHHKLETTLPVCSGGRQTPTVKPGPTYRAQDPTDRGQRQRQAGGGGGGRGGGRQLLLENQRSTAPGRLTTGQDGRTDEDCPVRCNLGVAAPKVPNSGHGRLGKGRRIQRVPTLGWPLSTPSYTPATAPPARGGGADQGPATGRPRPSGRPLRRRPACRWNSSAAMPLPGLLPPPGKSPGPIRPRAAPPSGTSAPTAPPTAPVPT